MAMCANRIMKFAENHLTSEVRSVEHAGGGPLSRDLLLGGRPVVEIAHVLRAPSDLGGDGDA